MASSRFDPTPPIFVNREGPLARFAEAAADIPHDGLRLLVFHGVGGQGKTALLRHIHKLAGPDGEPQYKHLRTAMLNLHRQRTSDPDLMPVWLRNAFARAGVSFPVFDLALARFWEISDRADAFPNLTNAWLSANEGDITQTGAEAVLSLAELAAEGASILPLGGLLRRGARWFIDKHRVRYLEIARPDMNSLPSEPWLLAERLPWLLAQDLNHHRKNHPDERFLLLVDEYERLFPGGDSGAHWRGNGFDMHMRRFLPEANGLLAVFGSRRMLPWGADPDWQEDLAAADCPLEGLKDHDAQNWLAQVPVVNPVIAAAMLEGAREDNRPDALVYPLLLDFQVAHWRSLTGRGASFGPEDFRVQAAGFEGRCTELAEVLMRGFEDDRSLIATIKRLCVANRFDRAAFSFVLEEFKTGLPLDFFDSLPNLSFITEGEDGWLAMHRAVAEAIAETLPEERRRDSVEALLRHFEERAAAECGLNVTIDKVAALFEAAHLRRFMGAVGYVDWLDKYYRPIRSAGLYRQCEILWQDALEFGRRHSEFNELDEATSISNLGYALRLQERLEEAEKYFLQGLDIRLRNLGEYHRKTASSYNNVGTISSARGYYEDALKFFLKSINILEHCPNDSKETLSTLYGNVAFLLKNYGKLGTAMKFARKGLRIRQKIYPPDHPKIASSYNTIAMILNARGCFEISDKFLHLCLNIRLDTLGVDSPDTAQTYNNIGLNLRKQGKNIEAERLYRKSLEIRAKILGTRHPLVAQSYNNLAAVLSKQGKLEESEALYRTSIEIKTASYGENHPSIAVGYNNLASNLRLQSRFLEAAQMQYKSYRVAKILYGPESKKTENYKNKLKKLRSM